MGRQTYKHYEPRAVIGMENYDSDLSSKVPIHTRLLIIEARAVLVHVRPMDYILNASNGRRAIRGDF